MGHFGLGRFDFGPFWYRPSYSIAVIGAKRVKKSCTIIGPIINVRE